MRRVSFGHSEPLAEYADTCSAEPQFCAYWMVEWCRRWGRGTADLCGELDCGIAKLVRLATCKAPDGRDTEYVVRKLAERFGFDRVILAKILFLCSPTLSPVLNRERA